MPRVIYTPTALLDLQRLREFLRPKNPVAAKRAAQAITQGVSALGSQPYIGRPIDDLPEQFRDWPIDFGDSGYVILAIRHQKEAGF
jgi:plasmid stabilization system protein ParE